MRLKTRLKAVSLVLVIVMSLLAIPEILLKKTVDALAEEINSEQTHVSEVMNLPDIDDKKAMGQAYVIAENEQNRTLNSKEYIMSDDTIIVQQYAENIHYIEDGEYKEIDNSLQQVSENDNIYYENVANSFKVRFSEGLSNENDYVEISEDGYTIQFRYVGEKNKVINSVVEDVQNQEISQINNYARNKTQKPLDFVADIGRITYDNVKGDTDLRYEVVNNKLKENIIINTRQNEYKYAFEIITPGLTLELNKDGSIDLVNLDGETKFKIPAPFMVDGNGKYSDAVKYSLSKNAKGYVLTLTANAEWINTATLPVTIDPIIESITQTAFTFTNVFENGSVINSGSEVYVGRKNGSERSNAYFRYESPSKGRQYTLLGAEFSFRHYTQGMGIFSWKNLKYKVGLVENVDSLSSITYANSSNLTMLETYAINGADTNVSATTGDYSYPINIDLIKDDVLTFGFICQDANSNDGYCIIYTSGTYGAKVEYRYKLITGIDEDYSMETFEIDKATAYVNNATGYLTMSMNVANVSTALSMPLQVDLVYNNGYNDVYSDIVVQNYFGNNFKLNYQQYLILTDGIYYYYDADGSITPFYLNSDGYYRPLNKNLVLTVTSQSLATICDEYGNTFEFEHERLTKITQQQDQGKGWIFIDYMSNSSFRIETIRTTNYSVSESYGLQFTYNSDNTKVTEITTLCYTQQIGKYTFEYSEEGNLTRINFTDSTNTNNNLFTLEYSNPYGEEVLTAIFNDKREGILFTYQQYSDMIHQVCMAMGVTTAGSKTFDYANFNYDKIYLTKVEYYSNHCIVGNSYASFDVQRNLLSTWNIDENGETHVYNPGEWYASTSSATSQRVRESYSYTEKINTSITGTRSLTTGQSVTGTISEANVDIPTGMHYQTMLNLKIRSNFEFSVTINAYGQTRTVSLISGGELYVSVPCGSITTGSYTITNNHSGDIVYISNISYSVVTYQKEIRRIVNSVYNTYRVAEITGYSENAYKFRYLYDTYGRLTSETISNKTSTEMGNEQTLYTYYTHEGSITNKVQTITRKINGEEKSVTTYTYDENLEVTSEITDYGEQKQSKTCSYQYETESVTVTETTNGISTVTVYKNYANGLQKEQVTSGYQRIKYQYDDAGKLTTIRQYDITNGTETLMAEQTVDYDGGLLKDVGFGGTQYSQEYNTTGMLTSIKRDGQNMLTYSYNTNTNNGYSSLQSKTYANGQIEEYNYINNDVQVSHKQSSTSQTGAVYTYNNDASDRLISATKSQNSVNLLTYDYSNMYNNYNPSYSMSGELKYWLTYQSNIDRFRGYVNNATLSITQNDAVVNTLNTINTHNVRDQLVSESIGSYTSNYTYDTLDRVSNVVSSYGNTIISNKTYNYKTYVIDGETYVSNMVSSIVDNTSANSDFNMYSEYNAKGQITRLTYKGEFFDYTYDALNRLKTENYNNYYTATYNYDSGNRLISKDIANYGIVNYNHNTQGQLTSYTEYGSTYYFAYDELGNPVKYKVNSPSANDNFTWTEGRKLASGTLNGNTFSYEYDVNGMRYKKTVNGRTTEYYYVGDRLVAENRINNGGFIYYLYDSTGIAGMIFEGEYYFFVKNTLGDVVCITDTSGEIEGYYTYESWGYAIDAIGYMAEINPFRYRGYYYDNETGFYYLQTRYYDPSTMRFINADDYELIPTLASTLGQLSLYSYCNNNPVMYTDETGESLTVAAIISFLAVVGVSAIDGAVSAHLSGDNWLIGLGAGAIGGIFGYFVGIFNPILGRAISSLIYDILNPLFQHGKFEDVDIVNIFIDLTLDVFGSSLYSTLLSKGKNKILFNILNSSIDAVIDVTQTEYIFKKITKKVNESNTSINSIITRFLFGRHLA